MQRGFKAKAERDAERIRTEMAVGPTEPLDAVELAKHIGAEVRCADQLTSLDKLERLEELQPGCFSACTFAIGNRHVIVYSPLASLGRRQSDLAHEASHLIHGHTMSTIETVAGLSFYTCDPDQEQEANWLAGCLLLPRKLLVRMAGRGLDVAAIAEQCNVSEPMAGFRLRATGVLNQLNARR